MTEGRYDVELKCTSCGRETLATNGCWFPTCACDGMRVVVVVHDHVLTWAECKALGYGIQPRGFNKQKGEP